MFTVCPKCALTLVVTAADLRVAQGYVRCGRCSNVFNALSRLSEDRQAAVAAAQSQASAQSQATPEPTPPSPQRSETSGTFRTRITNDPSATGKRPVDTSASAKLRQPSAPASRTAQPPPPTEPKRYDDDSIPEEDLEFNPDATDINKVFVEQPPSPQFTAATGTFKAIRLEAEGAGRGMDQLAQTDEHARPGDEHFDPTDTQVDVEIDRDLLASMAQITAKEPANPTRQDAPAPERRRPETAASVSQATRTERPVKQAPAFQPPMEPTAPAPLRLAERAKARAEAARTGADPARAPAVSKPEPPKRPPAQGKQVRDPGATAESGTWQKLGAGDSKRSDAQRASVLETTQALRAALAPRKRPSAAELNQTSAAEPTSLLAGRWTTGTIVLLTLLAIQVVHHFRNDLAANPTLNGPVTAIYAALGIPIVPRWDLDAYEVRQLGASAAAEGQITVRASVKNAAHQAQPLPLLRVTLQDRFGNRIASQDVPPQSYLPRAIPSSSLLSAGQRIDAEMTFVDPGSNAVGFEIDACLPAPGGGISCASDIAR